MKQLIPQTMTAVSVLALALAVGGCGSSSDDVGGMVTGPTPQEKCVTGGGQWNADDMSCTTAEELAMERAKMQRSTISGAIDDAEAAVAMVDNDSTDAEVTNAQTAIADARSAIMAAADVPEAEKAANSGTVDALENRLEAAKMARQTAMKDAQDTADKAMMATAMKLHMGISTPMGAAPASSSFTAAATDRTAAYNDANFPTDGTAVDTLIMVSAGGLPADTPEVVALSEDKKTMVADNHGWAGKRYADPAGGDSYEAVVYSNVEAPTEGRKFGSTADVTATGDYEYKLTADTDLQVFVLTETNAGTSNDFLAARVASSDFDQSAGTKSFKLKDGEDTVEIPGSYHGVPGMYHCTPGDDNTCAAQVAASGFNLGGTANVGNAFTADGGTWVFEPKNRDAKVMSSPDSDYASYGWWIRKSAGRHDLHRKRVRG